MERPVDQVGLIQAETCQVFCASTDEMLAFQGEGHESAVAQRIQSAYAVAVQAQPAVSDGLYSGIADLFAPNPSVRSCGMCPHKAVCEASVAIKQ